MKEQQGQIPLTNILAPGAMGTSRQVAPDTTAEGQAENRRIVVRILQTRGSPAPRCCCQGMARVPSRIQAEERPEFSAFR